MSSNLFFLMPGKAGLVSLETTAALCDSPEVSTHPPNLEKHVLVSCQAVKMQVGASEIADREARMGQIQEAINRLTRYGATPSFH
jgi:hypothetical protein